MALETLKDITETTGGEGISHENGTPNPRHYINADHESGRLSFKLQHGPIKESGVNGCQLTDMIEVAKMMLEKLNKKFPCRENALTITKLDEALMWQKKRTEDRERRGVEGASQA